MISRKYPGKYRCIANNARHRRSSGFMRITTKAYSNNDSNIQNMPGPSSGRTGIPKDNVVLGHRVTFENSSREKLAGLLVGTHSKDVVILCHGYCSSKNSPLITQLARELESRNLSSLRFDFSGNGESDGVFGYANYIKEAQDLRAAVLFMRNDLGRRVVAVAGHSKGGNAVLLYASLFDDVPLIVNIAGRFFMDRGIIERFGAEMLAKVDKLGQVLMTARTSSGETIEFILTKHDLEQRRTLDMKAAASKITISEVVTIHGTKDTVIPVEDAYAFGQSIRQHQMFLVNGADHNFREQQHSEAAIKKAADCIMNMV